MKTPPMNTRAPCHLAPPGPEAYRGWETGGGVTWLGVCNAVGRARPRRLHPRGDAARHDIDPRQSHWG